MNETSSEAPSVDEDTLAKLFEDPDEGQPETEDATEDEAEETTEEVEVEAVAEDDDDTNEVETDEAETAEDEGTDLVYEIDGEEVPAAQLKEWKRSGLREKDYTQKTQALAQERQAFEAEKQTELQSIQQQKAQLQDALATFAIDPEPAPDWADLAQRLEPQKFQLVKAQWEQKQVQKQQAQQQYQLMQQQTQQETLAREQAALLQHFPTWSDPAVSTPAMAKLAQTAAEYGIPNDEFGFMSDHRVFRVLHDLTELKKQVSEVKDASAAITKKVVKAKPKLPAGAKAKNQGNKAKAAKSLDRAIKSGDIDAVTDALMNQ